ncbi:MAG TPA: ABC transporter permease [Chitinophagaceae bacterium]
MFRNYLKTAWRNLWKNKVFSSINILGLAVGMAACILILQYVSFQLSFDQFNKNSADLYRVYNDRYQNGKLVQHGTITYSAIGKAMQEDFPEVVNHARVVPFSNEIVGYNGKRLGDLEALAADNSLLSMFTYPVISGDRRLPLAAPHTVVISETLAKKIFGATANLDTIISKGLMLGTDSTLFTVTGICRDVPENSHLKFDLLFSYSTLYTGPNAWAESDYDFKDSDFWHYIQLKPGTNYKALEAKFPAFSARHFQGSKVSGSDEKFFLQPLSRAHLYSDFEYEIGNTASSTVVWGLLFVAMLIIVIAWVNYVNLTTAKSVERAREVGVRKVAGASRQQLMRQFLSESLLINFSALGIALLLVFLVQPGFNKLVDHQLSLAYLFAKGLNGYFIVASLAILIVAGILVSGFYPAFVLSAFRPILVLKGKFASTSKGAFLRKALVVGQFAITVALIIGAGVVYRQIRFVNRQDLGMNISQMLIIRAPELTSWDSTFINRENTFTQEIKRIPHVAGASTSWNIPGGETGRSFNVRRADQDSTVHFTLRHTAVSEGYFGLYGIRLLAGRDFSSTDFNPDFGHLHNLIINESAAKLFGYASPRDAVGKTIIRGRKWEIIGVIANYHQKSLRYAVEPTLIMPAYSTNSSISVKVDAADVTTTVASIKKIYDEFFPGNLFNYFFLDDHFNQQYASDRLFGKVFGIFSAFAVLIAALGLLGLSLFSTTQRTKEIGVRKVLGASVTNIVLLLSKDFIRLVLIAIVIACPVAWYVMHSWLQDYAYRISISWWMFLGAGALAVLIAFLTISFQAIRAATGSPVKSLRTE